jgi:hypothetical protein
VLAKSIVGMTALMSASFVCHERCAEILRAHSVTNGASDSASIDA